jgi:hypothetical protein
MISIKRSLIMLATGAALVASGSLGASAAPAGSPSTALTGGAAADNGIIQVRRDFKGGGGGGKWSGGGGKWSGGGGKWSGGGGKWKGGGNWNGGGGKYGKYGGYNNNHRRNYGYNNFYYAAPFLAAPFFYGGYDDYGYGYSNYGYSNYGYGYGGGNSCYRVCRYEHGPRYCRYNWEDYC